MNYLYVVSFGYLHTTQPPNYVTSTLNLTHRSGARACVAKDNLAWGKDTNPPASRSIDYTTNPAGDRTQDTEGGDKAIGLCHAGERVANESALARRRPTR